MPLVGPVLKQKLQARILSSLSREFKDEIAKNPGAAASHAKLAAALSDIALDIVLELQTSAQVAPGIPVATAGSPAAQAGATTGPGVIL
jgi:hypothetical protein